MKLSTRRVTAFILDILLVMILSITMSNIDAVNPYKEKYSKASSEYTDVYYEFRSQFENFTGSFNESSLKELVISVKKVEKYSLYTRIWYLIFFILYFVIFQYFNDGQTLGKKFNRIKVVNKGDKKLGLKNVAIRSLFIGTNFYYGITLMLFIKTLLPFISNNEYYYTGYTLITLISLLLEFVLVIVMLINRGKKSLNDIISKTEVISVD